MPKRKVKSEEIEEDEASQESTEEKPLAKTARSSRTPQEIKGESDETPPAKKSKADKTKSTTKNDASTNAETDIIIKTTPEGEKYVELGKRKRVIVRSFKGTPLVDIREYYLTDGVEKPGKKGIALGLDQWEMIKKSSGAIDELLKGLNKE